MKSGLSIREIENLLRNVSREDKLIKELRNDERKGVIRALEKWEKQQDEKEKLFKQYVEMSKYETQLNDIGYKCVAGVDEVGRGPIAGPVVAAAVILPEEPVLGLNDSKKLTVKKRNELYEQIMEHSIVGMGIVTVNESERYKIFQATKLAMNKAVKACHASIDHLLIDAMTLTLPIPQTSLIKGDQMSVSIAAASIIAKVTRDRMMVDLARIYPQYGFDKNAGYGTKEHINALKQFGATKEHRHSFAPVKDVNATRWA